jgi:hypothetical protein
MSPYGAAEKTGTLMDAVTSVRSKNAGPFSLTFDLFFPNEDVFNDVVARNVLTKENISELYSIPASDVRIFPFKPALAIKVSIPRLLPGGSPGDTDVAGGQQFVPLLSLPL